VFKISGRALRAGLSLQSFLQRDSKKGFSFYPSRKLNSEGSMCLSSFSFSRRENQKRVATLQHVMTGAQNMKLQYSSGTIIFWSICFLTVGNPLLSMLFQASSKNKQ
jgi:hypothetical protein